MNVKIPGGRQTFFFFLLPMMNSLSFYTKQKSTASPESCNVVLMTIGAAVFASETAGPQTEHPALYTYTLLMRQYNEQKQLWKERGKTDILALGDPSVLCSDLLIHDCNLTVLHVCTHTHTHLLIEGALLILYFFLFHIKDI